jgi:hypothetical protein
MAGGVNLYEYAGNNPIAFTDPFGLCPCSELEEGWGGSDPGVLDPTSWLGAEEIKAGLALAKVGVVAVGLLARDGGEKLLGFAAGKWLEHFEKHGAEVGAKNAVEYLRGANELIRGGKGVETFVRKNGDKLFYRKSTNEFGVLAKDGKTIRTYFKPKEGERYFLAQRR